MLRRPATALGPAALLILTMLGRLTGCTSDPQAAVGKTTTDLAAVTVTGTPGSRPTVKVPAPFSADRTERRIIAQGRGPLVVRGQRVKVDYVGINGADGQEFDTSFGRTDRNQFVLNQPGAIKGWVEGLSGVAVGSRVLIAVPPKDAYGVSGVPSAGIGSTDTLVFVVDVEAAHSVLTRASGSVVKPKSGLPTVKLAKDGEPSVTLPSGKPPKDLVTQVLIKGTGSEVKKGQSITVQYVGAIWPGGKVFYNSWEKDDSPLTYTVGEGRLIAGWDIGLIGKPVGSQVLLVIPPDKGYGAQGQPELKIKGTDTLVFVVDILDATS